MNIHSKSVSAPKITKRQKKALNGPNASIRRSIESGEKFGGYIGKPPVYAETKAGFKKVQHGIPFVRPESFDIRL